MCSRALTATNSFGNVAHFFSLHSKNNQGHFEIPSLPRQGTVFIEQSTEALETLTFASFDAKLADPMEKHQLRSTCDSDVHAIRKLVNAAYVSQLAVAPHLKRARIGSRLMNYCEELARAEGTHGFSKSAFPATQDSRTEMKKSLIVKISSQFETSVGSFHKLPRFLR